MVPGGVHGGEGILQHLPLVVLFRRFHGRGDKRVAQHPGVAQCDVGALASAGTHRVDGLLRRTRHTADRRSVIIELTPRARALVHKLPPIFGRVTNQLFTGFTPEEINQITGVLRRMLANLMAPTR